MYLNRYNDSMRLGEVLKGWRTNNKLTVRDAAKKLCIPSAVYHRIERGESCNSEALAAIIVWLVRNDS